MGEEKLHPSIIAMLQQEQDDLEAAIRAAPRQAYLAERKRVAAAKAKTAKRSAWSKRKKGK